VQCRALCGPLEYQASDKANVLCGFIESRVGSSVPGAKYCNAQFNLTYLPEVLGSRFMRTINSSRGGRARENMAGKQGSRERKGQTTSITRSVIDHSISDHAEESSATRVDPTAIPGPLCKEDSHRLGRIAPAGGYLGGQR
jgi:hypothetical protein